MVQKDLTSSQERPSWKFSSYGLMKDEPCMLAGADISPEEVRLMHSNVSRTTGSSRDYVGF
jgi:hypothetical protein